MELLTVEDQTDKYLKESDRMLTPEELDKLTKSKPYINGLKAIKMAERGTELDVNEIIQAQDLLLTTMTMALGTRPGTTGNLKLRHYEEAESYQGNLVLLVSKHKTKEGGPARIGVWKGVQPWLKTWVEKIRPQIGATGEEHLFVNSSGKAYKTSTRIARRLTAFFEKTQVGKGTVPPTMIRKFISTITMENAPQSSALVAKAMAHSVRTQEPYYVRSNITKEMSEAMDVIEAATQLRLPTELPDVDSPTPAAAATPAATPDATPATTSADQPPPVSTPTPDPTATSPADQPPPDSTNPTPTAPIRSSSFADQPPPVPTPTPADPTATSSPADQPPPVQTTTPAAPIPTSSSADQRTPPAAREDPTPASLQSGPAMKGDLSDAQKEKVKMALSAEIALGNNITQAVAQSWRCNHPSLAKLASFKPRVKQVVNFC